MTPQSRAYLFAAITVLFWSTVATAFKFGLRFLDIFQLLFYACLTSAVVLSTVVAMQGKVHALFGVFKTHWKLTLIASVLNPFAYYLVLFEAYDRLPAQIAQPINYTWAITLAFMATVFLKQKLLKRDLIAAGVCYAGVVLIVTGGRPEIIQEVDLIGVGLALGSTLIWASYWIINVRDPRDPVIAMCLNFLLALVPTGLVCAVFSDFAAPLQGLAAAVYAGLFEMSLAFLCWSYALRLSENTARVSNLIFLSPFLSLFFINQLLGESIYASTYIGLVVIIVGLFIQQRGRPTAALN